MRREKLQDPLKVQVTDELREWAGKRFDAPYLPDEYLSEFHDSCRARGPKYKDAKQAFRNWINWSAPGGRFHRAEAWESKLKRAKQREHRAKTSKPAPTVAGRYVNENGYPISEPLGQERSAAQVARAAIAQMKGAMK